MSLPLGICICIGVTPLYIRIYPRYARDFTKIGPIGPYLCTNKPYLGQICPKLHEYKPNLGQRGANNAKKTKFK